MNVLWDFRLFSYGYSKRGVGNYCRSVANSILDSDFTHKLFVWGDKSKISGIRFNRNVTWIPYSSGNWKKDIITIPLISNFYHIDLFHYWIISGPLYSIGIAPFNRGHSVAIIHDLGIELWDIPYCRAIKKSLYWKVQKKLLQNMDYLFFVSDSTRSDFQKFFPQYTINNDVLYMPIPEETVLYSQNREPYLITLGGSPHKNLSRTLKAFSTINATIPDYKLIVMGDVKKCEEDISNIPQNVIFEPNMAKYKKYLKKSCGLISCSLYEGFGIVPLEAMACGCPVLVSDIPPYNETCSSFAKKADPFEIKSIAKGILDIIKNNNFWIKCSIKGISEYNNSSKFTASKCINVYEKFKNK